LGDDIGFGGLVDQEYEIFGRPIAADGDDGLTERISFMGGTGDSTFGAARASLSTSALGQRFCGYLVRGRG
jgi:hypothetical protein